MKHGDYYFESIFIPKYAKFAFFQTIFVLSGENLLEKACWNRYIGNFNRTLLTNTIYPA